LIQYLVPSLSKKKFDLALRKAGVALSDRRAEALRRRISVALATYAVGHLARENGRGAPSQIRKRLRQIEAAAASEDKITCERLTRDPAYASAMQDIDRMAKICDDSIRDPARDLGRLRRLAGAAGARLDNRIRDSKDRAKDAKKREPRNRGNPPMRALIGTLNGLWMIYFRRMPGVSGGHAGLPRGAYIVFVQTVLQAFAFAISDDIEAAAPGFRVRLKLSPQAIHGYFRRTGISKLRRA
jgi:hypothetical protein